MSDFTVEMKDDMDCEGGIMFYNVRWPSEWEHLEIMYDWELEKECEI